MPFGYKINGCKQISFGLLITQHCNNAKLKNKDTCFYMYMKIYKRSKI